MSLTVDITLGYRHLVKNGYRPHFQRKGKDATGFRPVAQQAVFPPSLDYPPDMPRGLLSATENGVTFQRNTRQIPGHGLQPGDIPPRFPIPASPSIPPGSFPLPPAFPANLPKTGMTGKPIHLRPDGSNHHSNGEKANHSLPLLFPEPPRSKSANHRSSAGISATFSVLP